MSEPRIFGGLPTGRRLDNDFDPKVIGSVGILKPYSRELGALLRRSIRQIDDADLERDDRGVFTDTDGSQYEVIREFVDPISPQDSLAEAFVVRDNLVVFLKPLGSRHEVKSVHMGEMSGGRVS